MCFRKFIPAKELAILDEMQAKWGDKSISLVGLHSIVVLVLVVALTWMGWLLHQSVEGTKEVFKDAIADQTRQIMTEHMAMSEEFRRGMGRVTANQDKIAESMDAQTYLMTKTEAERKLYKMDMPDGLRRRIR